MTYYHGTKFPMVVLAEGIRPASEQDNRVAGKSFDNSDDDHVYLAGPDDKDLAATVGIVLEVELTDAQEAALEPDPDSSGYMLADSIDPSQLRLPGDEFRTLVDISGQPLMPADVQGLLRENDFDADALDDQMQARIE